MADHPSPRTGLLLPAWIALAASGWLACAHGPAPAAPDAPDAAQVAQAAPAPAYSFFEPPTPGDRWRRKIGGWQMRQRAARGAGLFEPLPEGLAPIHPVPAAVAAPPVGAGPRLAPREDALAHHYRTFLDGRRRALAAEIVAWVQELASERFVEDGPLDHWPTLVELLHARGDDCDGFELMSYHALRQLGFPEHQVFRAILRQRETGQHHMVTLWFEDPSDPWLIDPTGTITTRLRRLSSLQGWIPLKVFSESAEYTVGKRREPPEPSPGQAAGPTE